MARYTGKSGELKSGAGPDAVGELRNWEFEESGPQIDDSVMGTSGGSFQVGQVQTSGSFDLFWDPADAGQGNLVAGSQVAVELYPDDDVSGKTKFAGTVSVLSVRRSATVAGMIEASVRFGVVGSLTESTVA